MLGRQHQTHLKIKHRRVVQAAARQNIGGHHQIQFTLLQRRLWVEGDAGMEVDLHMWPAGAEILQRRRQPLNTAVTFDSQPQPGLLWFVTVLQGASDLRQHLVGQL
ncbi:hypothetical protein KPC190_04516 [Klebsiella pneumoniae]|uniref:Uncharacterized protein n=1 Tax=Klebsiella pneumoniae TaxID=573 RepID=A0A377WA82_KLEPN|nr:hypothetical protein [Klebsiella pneumoniae]MCB8867043.1 hypothetical protein [Klebsiella pneumoniae]MCB8870119.1 hypothetical protein [Klebsiella pneumoniae]STT51744.1 Uncharacterised protein [Klebsiella pneumoniae]